MLVGAAIIACGTEKLSLDNGARCSLNSDCRVPLVCGFERCRVQCVTSRDCDGRLCVRGDLGGNVCQLDDEVECNHNSECPGTQLCGPDRRCRDVCITDRDCVTDLLCVTRVCARPDELSNGRLPERAPVEEGASCTYATDCPGDLVCLYGRCDVECLGDKDCLVGWACRPQATGGDGRCYPEKGSDAGRSDAMPDGSPADASGDSSADAASDAADGGDASDAGSAALQPSAIAMGVGHTCTLLANGRVKCWGLNGDGQLGLGDGASRGDGPNEMGDALPFVDLGTARTAKALSLGYFHSCVLLDNDRVKCWGKNNAGQLGLGDTTGRGGAANQMGDSLPYVDLGAGRTALSIHAGGEYTCAKLDNGGVKCWGINSAGQLGLGDALARGDAPNEMGDNLPYVNFGVGRTAATLSTGFATACALLDNNLVKCWGGNGDGQLGLGDTQNRGDAANEMGDNLPFVDFGVGRTAKAVSASPGHTCAVLDNDRVKCWGFNDFGQLGLGDMLRRGDGPAEMGDSLPYVELGTGRTAKELALGANHSCALLDNDALKCWGRNANGQLGYGDTVRRGDGPNEMGDNLLAVNLGTARFAKKIASYIFQGCAILDDDRIKCWGANGSGVLGLGDTLNRGDQANQMGDNLPAVKLIGP